MAKKRAVRTVTSISIPADLRRRMSKLKNPPSWSAIACAAFELELSKVESMKEVRAMKDVVERLRASQVECANEMFQNGHAAGQEWAKRDATAKQLQRLESLKDRLEHEPSYNWDYYFNPGTAGVWTPAEGLFCEMEGVEADTDSRYGAEKFWRGYEENDVADGDWLKGFAEGALAIWREVQSQL